MSLNILVSLLLVIILAPLFAALVAACKEMKSPSTQSPSRLGGRRDAAAPYGASARRPRISPDTSARSARI